MNKLTTLCYIEKDNKYLMLHRIKKENDINHDKWIGVGGKFEWGESPEECMLREVWEETGYTLTSWQYRGIITFVLGEDIVEYMSLFTADGFEGTPIDCNEGVLEWVEKDRIPELNLWEGDRIFFRLLEEQKEFFSLKLVYNKQDILDQAVLDAKELEIVTLENAVYMNMKNDQAFLLDMQLNLYEHQSTWNPNMPLRFLIYVTKEYQMLIRNQTLYASTLVELPTPHFVVFYNGEEEREAESVLKLSHSFCQKADEPELELIVKVLNINLDKKQRILETCCLLKEYMLLVDKIRKYAAEYKDINRAAEQAVTECIEENILADFLRKNRTEAIEVCIFEYDEKREKELIRKAEYAEGKKEGLKEGQKQGEERVFGIYRLYRDKYTENQIAEQMKIDVDEVRNILEKFKE